MPPARIRFASARAPTSDVAAAQLDAKNTLRRGDVLLMQMEIPPEEVFGALAKARAIGAHSVLNVAP